MAPMQIPFTNYLIGNIFLLTILVHMRYIHNRVIIPIPNIELISSNCTSPFRMGLNAIVDIYNIMEYACNVLKLEIIEVNYVLCNFLILVHYCQLHANLCGKLSPLGVDTNTSCIQSNMRHISNIINGNNVSSNIETNPQIESVNPSVHTSK